jgi:outer membrane lipoprotein-sorting protein
MKNVSRVPHFANFKLLFGHQPIPHVALICLFSLFLSACGGKTANSTATVASVIPNAEAEGERIIGQYRALDNSRDSSIKMAVAIQEADGQTHDVQLDIASKRESDGKRLLMIAFTAPAQERDRNALLTVTPQGEIEGTRYVQMNDSFITAKGATNEDSFFGMTAQEMVDGQPEKYTFRLLGEEQIGATPVYKVEGTLKKGAESKFNRIVMFIDKTNYTALRAEFYDNKNELQRQVNIKKNEQINGHWTRTHYTIDNLARKKKLNFEIKEVKYDQNLSPSIFTKEYLKKTTVK